MAKQPPITFKHSSSLSEIEDDDIIYDIISSDDENYKESSLTRAGSLPHYNNNRVKMSPKPFRKPLPRLPDKQSPRHALIPIKGFEKKEIELSELVDESIVKLPVVVEVITGNYGGEENSTFANGERYLLCYKTDTCYVSCGNSGGDRFSIPVIARYEVALVNLEHEFANKTNVSVDNIMDMKRQPSRILANSSFEINRIQIVKKQILEIVKPGSTSADQKYLKVHTLSGEEIDLPKTLKQTFSCSIKTKSEPLPNAIETCLFPQRVILTDTATPDVIKKQMCTLIKCFVKKTFLARIYKDEYTSIPTEESLIEIPPDLNITVKLVGKPSDTSLIHEILKRQSNKYSNEIKAKALAKLPPPKPEKPLKRSKSIAELRTTRITSSQISVTSENNRPSTPQPEKKHFFPSPEKKQLVIPFEHGSSVQMPLVASRPTSAAAVLKPSDVPKKGKQVETWNKKQHIKFESEINSLQETNQMLETKLAKEKALTANLEKRIASLEKSLEEANSTISANDFTVRNLLLSKRALPGLPSNAGSAPTSPLSQHKMELSSVPWRNQMNSPPPLLKPSKLQSYPHYQKPRDLLSGPQHELEQGTETTDDMKSILQKINLSQYVDAFLKEGINMEILGTLDEDILENDLKIKNVLHRKKLLKLAKKVKNKEDISNFYVDPQVLLKDKKTESIYQLLD